MKKTRQYHDTDYKRRIVAEYLSGTISADALAKREGLVRGQIYKWRVQLERRNRAERIEEIADTEGVSIEQARKIRELLVKSFRLAVPPRLIFDSLQSMRAVFASLLAVTVLLFSTASQPPGRLTPMAMAA